MGKPDRILFGFAAFSVLLHVATSAWTDYGYFIDELYYLACSKRLAFGYVDHPPLSIWLLALSRGLFGDSLPALRLLPALAGAGTIFLSGRIARALGCGARGQVLTGLAVLVAPAYLLLAGFYSMNEFELLIWTACTWVLLRIVREGNVRSWIAVGALIGIGLEFKHTMILYVFATAAGLLISRSRSTLRSRYVLHGIGLALVLLLPNLLWQIRHGFPSLEFYRNAILYKNAPTPPLAVVAQQVVFMNPLAFPLWLAGLWFCLVKAEGRPYRTFGFSYVILLLVMIASRSSRPDRIMAAYPILFATGARALELLSAGRRARLSALAIAAVALGGIIVAPVAVPILRPDSLIRYMSALGLEFRLEKGKSAKLPQWFADRFGWEELASEVTRVCDTLAPVERRHAAIFAGAYGPAGAIEFFGPRDRLPRVISTHNSYFLWGPGPDADSIRVLVTVLVGRDELERYFDDVQLGGLRECAYCMDYESRVPIYIARRPKGGLAEGWPGWKHYE
jgi:hypothetical protein